MSDETKCFRWTEYPKTAKANEIVYSDMHEIVISPNGDINYTVYNSKGEVISRSKGYRVSLSS